MSTNNVVALRGEITNDNYKRREESVTLSDIAGFDLDRKVSITSREYQRMQEIVMTCEDFLDAVEQGAVEQYPFIEAMVDAMYRFQNEK